MANGDMNTIGFYRVYLFGIPAAFMLFALISLEVTTGKGPFDRLQWFDDISYSLYLWHFTIFLLVA